MSLLENNFPKAQLKSKDHIFDLYITKQFSLPDLQKATGISTKTLYFILNFFKIPLRTRSQANGGSVATAKRERTFNKKYGAKNPLCRGTTVFEKRNATVKRKYGVENVWMLKDVQRKITNTHLEKYGAKRVVRIGSNKINKFEQKVADALINLAIPFQYSVTIKGRQFDFRVCENVLIECNGSFWHANPKKYQIDEIIQWPGGPVRAGDIWDRDAKKFQIAKSSGFELIYIWDDEDIEKTILDALDRLRLAHQP